MAYEGLRTAGHPVLPKPGEFRFVPSRRPRDPDSRCTARTRRADSRPQLRNSRMRARHHRHSRPDRALPRQSWRQLVEVQIIVFDMDGVLAEVTESYREGDRPDRSSIFTGKRIDARADSGLQEPGRLEQRLGAFAEDRRGSRRRVPYRHRGRPVQRDLSSAKTADGLIRARDGSPSPACSNACASDRTGASSPAACATKPKSPQRASPPDCVVRSDACAPSMSPKAKPAPEGLLAIQRPQTGTQALVRRRYRR